MKLQLRRPPVRKIKRKWTERFPDSPVDPYEDIDFSPLMDRFEEFVLKALEDFELGVSRVIVEYEFRGDYGPAFVARFGL